MAAKARRLPRIWYLDARLRATRNLLCYRVVRTSVERYLQPVTASCWGAVVPFCIPYQQSATLVLTPALSVANTALLHISFLSAFHYLLRVLLQKITGSQIIKKFRTFYGTRKFITAFQEPATWPYSAPDKSNPYRHPNSWRFTLISSLHLRMSSKWHLPRFHHQNPICTSPLHLTCHMLHQSHSSYNII